MSMPGRLLSQPAKVTRPSKRSACITASTESAMISRLTSDARMPSWPIEMPSDTAMVMNSIGKPPASRTPTLERLASRSSGMLQGVTSFHDDATATCGLSQSSSVMPIARSIARAGARLGPSVTSRLRGLMSTGVSPCSVSHGRRLPARAPSPPPSAFGGLRASACQAIVRRPGGSRRRRGPGLAEVGAVAAGDLVGLDAEAVADDRRASTSGGKKRSSMQSRKRVGTSGQASSGHDLASVGLDRGSTRRARRPSRDVGRHVEARSLRGPSARWATIASTPGRPASRPLTRGICRHQHVRSAGTRRCAVTAAMRDRRAVVAIVRPRPRRRVARLARTSVGSHGSRSVPRCSVPRVRSQSPREVDAPDGLVMPAPSTVDVAMDPTAAPWHPHVRAATSAADAAVRRSVRGRPSRGGGRWRPCRRPCPSSPS